MSICIFLDTEQGDKGSGPVTGHNISEITQDCLMQPAALCTLRYICICRMWGHCRNWWLQRQGVGVFCGCCIRISNFTAVFAVRICLWNKLSARVWCIVWRAVC